MSFRINENLKAGFKNEPIKPPKMALNPLIGLKRSHSAKRRNSRSDGLQAGRTDARRVPSIAVLAIH